MNFREIKTDDLKVKRGWACSSGKIRVHVSLKQASFVNKTYWITESDAAKPETLARVKQDLADLLQNKMSCLTHYLKP